MSCASGYGRFGKHPYFKTGSRFWVIKLLGKKSFYRLFNTLLRPFSAFNFSAASAQGLLDQDEDEDQQQFKQSSKFARRSQFVPFSVAPFYSTTSFFPLLANSNLSSSTKRMKNPFVFQSSLQDLAKTNENTAFDRITESTTTSEPAAFIHAFQLVNNPIAMDDFSLDDVETVFSDYEFEDREDPMFNNNSSSSGSKNDCMSSGTSLSLSAEQSIVVQSLDATNTSSIDVSVY